MHSVNDDKIVKIAQICHQANREFQILFPVKRIPVSLDWSELSEDDKQPIIAGVAGLLNGDTPETSHIILFTSY